MLRDDTTPDTLRITPNYPGVHVGPMLGSLPGGRLESHNACRPGYICAVDWWALGVMVFELMPRSQTGRVRT